MPVFSTQMYAGRKDTVNHMAIMLNYLCPEKCVKIEDENADSGYTMLSYGTAFYSNVVQYTYKQYSTAGGQRIPNRFLNSCRYSMNAIISCCTGALGIFTSIARFKALNTLTKEGATAMEKSNAAQILKFSGSDIDTIKELSRAGNKGF